MESCPKSRERGKISKFLGGVIFKYCVIFIPIYLGKIPHVDSDFVEVLACFGSCWRVQSRCFGTPPLRRAALDMTPKKPPENLRVFIFQPSIFSGEVAFQESPFYPHLGEDCATRLSFKTYASLDPET